MSSAGASKETATTTTTTTTTATNMSSLMMTTPPRRGCFYENEKIESHEMTHAHNNRFTTDNNSKRRVSSLDRSRTHETDFCRSSNNGVVGSMTAKKHSKVVPQQSHGYPDIDVDCIENYSQQMDKCQSSPSTSTGSGATKSMTNGMEKTQKQQQTHHYRSRSNDTDSGHGSGITFNGISNGTTSKHSSQSQVPFFTIIFHSFFFSQFKIDYTGVSLAKGSIQFSNNFIFVFFHFFSFLCHSRNGHEIILLSQWNHMNRAQVVDSPNMFINKSTIHQDRITIAIQC